MNTIYNKRNNYLKLLIYNPYNFYFIPITNSKLINVNNIIKSKVSMYVNNYDMTLIKQIINCILYFITILFPTDIKKSIIKSLFKKMTINILLITAQLHFYHKLVIYLKKLYRLSNFIIIHKIIKVNMDLFHFQIKQCRIKTFRISFYKKNNENKIITTIFLDLKKALDIDDHIILLKKTLIIWNKRKYI